MGDLVKDMRYGELTATLERLQQQGILPEHLARLRRYRSVRDGVVKALKAPVVTSFALKPMSDNHRRLDELTRFILIREWQDFGRTRLTAASALEKLCITEFGEPTKPSEAHAWLVANGIKPAGIGTVAIFACQTLTDEIDYGVIGTATRTKADADGNRYVPCYQKRGTAGLKREVSRLPLDWAVNGYAWRYLGIIEA